MLGKTKERIYRAKHGENSLVSSIAVSGLGTSHEHVRLWMRGAYVGELVMVQGDAREVATVLGLVDVGLSP
jgi:hypothetical protein